MRKLKKNTREWIGAVIILVAFVAYMWIALYLTQDIGAVVAP